MRAARLALALGTLLVVAPANASASRGDMPGLWPGGSSGLGALKLEFFGQAEVGGFAVLNDFSRFGGLGVKSTASLEGFGVALGARWERDRAGSGGGVFGESQLRPFALAQWSAYRYVDPYLALGGELGASTRGFRGSIYGAAGIDVALSASEAHPALNLEYQRRIRQTPDDFSDQALWLGLSVRTIM